MKSSRPYLLRGLYEWMLDNDATPHLLVEEGRQGVMVPSGYSHDGMLVLSVSPSAVQGLEMTNDYVSFSARFGGKPHDVWIPMAAVKGIFSKETGEGMQFMTEPGEPPAEVEMDEPEPPTPGAKPGGSSAGPQRSGLRVVK